MCLLTADGLVFSLRVIHNESCLSCRPAVYMMRREERMETSRRREEETNRRFKVQQLL